VILLARHGETDDNIPPLRFQGLRDTPLNARGREQAHALAARVAEGHPDLRSLYSSQLSRAHETAEIVGAAVGLEPVVDARFAESFRGEWEGFLFGEIQERDPEGFAAFRRAGAGFRFPGGESMQEHQDRVLAGIEDVRRNGSSPALIVCHGGSIRVALCAREGVSLDHFWEFEVPNTMLVEL
jgi:2,3-bisphosphoglycerate-dependent phosphoglycerate mutase